MANFFVKAVEYVPEVLVKEVFEAVDVLLNAKGRQTSLKQGFERQGTKAWDVVTLQCETTSLNWRSDRPRNFTVKRHKGKRHSGNNRTFRVLKDDTVNVGKIVAKM